MISIIIPVFNVAPYLRACLDSIVAQTYGDWEVICIDDGSTDSSGLILDEYSKADGRIVVVHQINAGVCRARNNGLRMARGEYITFVDSDDVLRESAYEKMMGLVAECPDVDMVMLADSPFKDGDLPSWGSVRFSPRLLQYEELAHPY